MASPTTIDPGPVVDDPAPSGALRGVLTHREFRRFAGHHLVAGTAQSLGTVAVATALYHQTGSTTWVAAAAAARLVPYLTCAGVAGALADRMDRRRLLLWSSNWRALMVVALAAAIAVEAHPSIAVALVFVGTAIGTGSYPAVLAVLPGTVPERDLVAATTLVNAAETAAWLLGPAVGGLLVMSTDPAWSLLANAALFGLGATLLVPTRPRPAAASTTSGVLVDIATGARIIVADARIRCPLILVAAVNLVVGASPIVLLVGSDEWFGADGTHFALLSAALGFGGFCVVALTTRLAHRANVMTTLTFTSVASCVPFAVMALAMGPSSGLRLGPLGPVAPGLAVVLVAVAGAAMVATEVVAITVMLRHLPDEVTARVIGLVDSTLVAAVLVGSVVAGPVIAVLGLEPAALTLALVIPVAAVAASRWRRHETPDQPPPAMATIG